jgi:glutathione S-transferase
MTLELYHLHLSQSERLVWLLEEMQIPYTLKNFIRNPKTGLAPEDLKAIVSFVGWPFGKIGC